MKKRSVFEVFQAFLVARQGNVAMIFAICSIAIFGLAGGALDYTRMSNSQTSFQDAVDAAALTTATRMNIDGWEEAKQMGSQHFEETISSVDGTVVKSLEIQKVDDDTVVVTAAGVSENLVMGVVGIEKFNFEVSSTVNRPVYPVEIALVLDSTFSMSVSGKMTNLKSRAREFVNTLMDYSEGNVSISIVPFAQYVNVGTDKLGASWLDARNETITIPRSCVTNRDIISKSGCSTTTTNHPRVWVPESCSPGSSSDGVTTSPPTCTPGYWQDAYTTTSETCTNYTYGPEYETCTPEQTYTKYWNGCVASRNHPWNLRDQQFSRKVPGPNDLICPTPITALTDQRSTLLSAINALTPVGNTYIPQGIVWGTRTLSNQQPFGEAISDSQRIAERGKRYMIVMTDGVNFSSPLVPTSPLHDGTDTNKSDRWMGDACTDAKAKDILLYTISFGSGVDAATKSLMQQCATQPGLYFHASGGSALGDAFQEIANSIMTVYLSQ